MNKELKEILEKSSQALEKLQDSVEDIAKDLPKDVASLWEDVKSNFTGVNDKLKNATKDLDKKGDEANLQAHLGAMEAHDRLNNIKESVSEFTHKVATKAETQLDIANLRAHLAKMEAEDFWEKKGKTISHDFQESSHKVQQHTIEAASEIKEYFEKLSETFFKKS